MHTSTTVSLKPNFWFLFVCAIFFLICIFFNHSILNLYNKNPLRFALHIFGLKCCLFAVCHDNDVLDEISAKTVPF